MVYYVKELNWYGDNRISIKLINGESKTIKPLSIDRIELKEINFEDVNFPIMKVYLKGE